MYASKIVCENRQKCDKRQQQKQRFVGAAPIAIATVVNNVYKLTTLSGDQ